MEDDFRNAKSLSVVTSFGRKGWELYGREFVETFFTFWPKSVRLRCYWEGDCPDSRLNGLGHDLLTLDPCRSFLDRHSGNRIVSGKQVDPRFSWGPKANKSGYNFRFDAYKFSRKVFAVAHASREQKTGRMFWIDADVVSHNAISEKFLIKLLPSHANFCYMYRGPRYHSELGFVGYNLNHKSTHDFIDMYENVYASDDFMNHGAWDDCNTFDMLVRRMKPSVNLIDHKSMSHPFDHSDLANYMYHKKGSRKKDAS